MQKKPGVFKKQCQYLHYNSLVCWEQGKFCETNASEGTLTIPSSCLSRLNMFLRLRPDTLLSVAPSFQFVLIASKIPLPKAENPIIHILCSILASVLMA